MQKYSVTYSKNVRPKKEKWVTLLYSGVFCLGLFAFLILFHFSENPVQVIVGNWEERSWEYEKVNKTSKEKEPYKEISEEVKELIGQKLAIHTAETWQFRPNGDLILVGSKEQKKIRWKLNGRGHVLELKDNTNKENYNITVLNDSSMVINFDTDMEVRGIAKLSFVRKQRNHDLEIQ